MAQLKRTLRLAECVFFGVGSILGAGIYTLIGKVAGASGNLIWLSFGIASVTAMCTAFSYAELSAMFPKSGGEFVYAKKAFGRTTGSFLGFIISLNGVIAGAVVSLGFGGYLSSLTGWNSQLLSMAIVMVIFLINSIGIRESSVVNIIFTCIEISGLIIVIWASYDSVGSVNYLELPENGFSGVITGSILAFFAYVGFEEIVKLAEETKNPEKTIPKALFISNIIVVALYGVVSICVISVIPFDKLAQQENPLAAVVELKYGGIGLLILSIIALFATSNTILSNMIGSSRVIFDMSDEISFLKPFSGVWKKRKTPIASLFLILVLMILFVWMEDIEMVALLATFTIFITFGIVNLSAIRLRYKSPEIQRPFRIPLSVGKFPLISFMGLLLTFTLLIYNVITIISS